MSSTDTLASEAVLHEQLDVVRGSSTERLVVMSFRVVVVSGSFSYKTVLQRLRKLEMKYAMGETQILVKSQIFV